MVIKSNDRFGLKHGNRFAYVLGQSENENFSHKFKVLFLSTIISPKNGQITLQGCLFRFRYELLKGFRVIIHV